MKLTNLKPADYNPRIITDEQLERLKKSLAEFGDLSGIVFNRRTGHLVGGHQRLKCLPADAKIEKKDLKEKTKTGTVAQGFIIFDGGEKHTYREVDWDEATEKMANIAANKHGGEWDDDKLGELLKELSEMPVFDIDLIGFETNELNNILASLNERLTDPDDVPELPETKPITKTGDLYILGEHRLLCGDTTKKEDLERLMDGKKADMVFTDPPYGVSIVSTNKSKGSIGFGGQLGFVGADGIVPVNAYTFIKGDDTTETAKLIYNYAVTNGIKKIILWGGNYYTDFCPPTSCWLIWDKRGNIPSNNFADCEIAWSNMKSPSRIYKQIWSGLLREGDRKTEGLKRCHPTQKPVGLAIWCFENYSKREDIILDLFLGSGSTLIACEKTGRVCYGMEIDPVYCDVIVQRWEKFTGKTAVLETRQEPILVKN